MPLESLAGPTQAEVDGPEEIGDIDAQDVPRQLEQAVTEIDEAIDNMEEEGMDYVRSISAVQNLSADFLTSAPDDVNIGDGTHCSGIGVQASDGSVVYREQTASGAYSPQNHYDRYGSWPQVNKHLATGATTVGTVQSPGRMNGDFGWSTDRNLIVGTLASYAHNYVAKLIAYFERASLPFEGGWQLPNLVLAETEEPNQFVPDASFSFSTRPALNTTFSVVLASPTATTVGFDIWNSDKESVARVKSVDIPQGESRTFVRATNVPPSNGYFNIVPRDAPDGITVKEVSTQPMSF